MTLLRSKATRAIFSDNGTLKDLSEAMRTWEEPNHALPWIAAEDFLYLGHAHKFLHRYVALSSANTAAGGTPAVDEVQLVEFSDIPDEGSFSLIFSGQETSELPFDATAEMVENALRALVNLSGVEVAGDFNAGFEITFSGSDGGKNQPLLSVGVNTLETANVALTITPSQVTAGSPGTLPDTTTYLSAEYWNGQAWVAFTDFLDETNAFSRDGFIQWEDRPEWREGMPSEITGLTTLAGEEKLYWMRLKLSQDAANLAIRAIKFLLSDDRLMPTLYEAIFQYLPDGKTDFLPQHEAAKDLVISKLKREGVLAYEEQIKDPSEWSTALTYKTIKLILDPIPGDEKLDRVRETMQENFEDTFGPLAATLDANKNEKLDASEKERTYTGSIGVFRR